MPLKSAPARCWKTGSETMGDKVEITVASDTRWLALIRRVIDEFCQQAGLDARERHSVTLAVGEAAANVMKHSYRGDHTKQLSLVCRHIGDGIEIEIRDQGEPFDPDSRPLPPPDELRAGGRGLYLIRAMMDSVEYRRDGATNSVRLRKMLKTPVEN
jgi:serine/threonine-protein kinase RsbW